MKLWSWSSTKTCQFLSQFISCDGKLMISIHLSKLPTPFYTWWGIVGFKHANSILLPTPFYTFSKQISFSKSFSLIELGPQWEFLHQPFQQRTFNCQKNFPLSHYKYSGGMIWETKKEQYWSFLICSFGLWWNLCLFKLSSLLQ